MKRCLSAIVALCATSFLAAHETWLLSAQFAVPAGQEIRLDLTSGMAFPQPDHPIKPERVAVARFRIGTQEGTVKDFQPQKQTLRLAFSPPQEGLATVWVRLHPRSLELQDEQVEEYFAEIAATPEVRAAWERLKGKQRWKEEYVKCAKTFVRVGAAEDDPSWQKPVGMPLEIMPQVNPLAVPVGQEATFVLLADGKPMPKLPVGLMREGSTERVFQTTDAQGRVSFPIGKAGKVLVYAVDLRLAPNGMTWESKFATLTGEARHP